MRRLAEDFERYPIRASWASIRKRVVSVVFGDRIGLTIFLGALVFFGLYWRIGFFLTDNWVIANTLVGVADGHLYVDEIVYGRPENQPGMHVVDGRLYGRNYGHVFLVLPFLWVLEALTVVVDPRVLVVGFWSLLVLGFSIQIGALTGQREEFAVVGSLGATGLFVANVAFATPIELRWLPVMALQVSTMVAGAMIGVVLYRLVASFHGRRTGAFVGSAVVLSTPVGFWASIPKRHVVTALFALVALYGFAVSRQSEGDRSDIWHRALAYAMVGLTTWVHAAEGFVLFVVLLAADLLSERSKSSRELAIVGAVFCASLVPFLLTNTLIAGSPLEPPRMLPSAGTESFNVLAKGAESGGGGGSGSTGIISTILSSVGLLPVVDAVISRAGFFGGLMMDGVMTAVVDPSRVFHTFVRSGQFELVIRRDEPAINLTVLEATPILGALLAAPVVVGRRIEESFLGDSSWRSAKTETDLFALGYVVVLMLLYLPRLPLNAQVTVRYLLPTIPMLIYLVGRLPPVRRVVDGSPRLLVGSVGGMVLVGGQLLVALLVTMDLSIGELMQVHALVGVVVAVLTGVYFGLEVYGIPVDRRYGAVLVSVSVAFGIVFLLLSGIEYLRYGDFALPLVRLVSRSIPII